MLIFLFNENFIFLEYFLVCRGIVVEYCNFDELEGTVTWGKQFSFYHNDKIKDVERGKGKTSNLVKFKFQRDRQTEYLYFEAS